MDLKHNIFYVLTRCMVVVFFLKRWLSGRFLVYMSGFCDLCIDVRDDFTVTRPTFLPMMYSTLHLFSREFF